MKTILKFLISISIIFFIFLSNNRDVDNGNDILTQMNRTNNNILNKLFYQHNTDILLDSVGIINADFNNKILKQPIVIDSIIEGIYYIAQEYYVKAYVKTDTTDRIMTVFKCERDTAETIKKFEYKHAYLTVEVEQMKIENSIGELNNIDNKKEIINLGMDIFLFGQLLDAVELPSINYYNNNYWN